MASLTDESDARILYVHPGARTRHETSLEMTVDRHRWRLGPPGV